MRLKRWRLHEQKGTATVVATIGFASEPFSCSTCTRQYRRIQPLSNSLRSGPCRTHQGSAAECMSTSTYTGQDNSTGARISCGKKPGCKQRGKLREWRTLFLF
eukprot:SAG31_NODE_31146_length_371_cov_1.290441_1_plen_102_part_10